jgi:antitoxin component YwqK of YwqJK toxin-antitoxin module
MMILRLLFIGILFLFGNTAFAQSYSDQIPQMRKYKSSEVVDSAYGITMFDKMAPSLGGDSLRYDKKGYSAQGWLEDYYVSGKLLHKGFYVDGELRAYKNYYENDQQERTFRMIDYKHSEVIVYYPDGKLKSQIHYYSKAPQKEIDYYRNGNIDMVEENYGDNEYLIKRNSFYENGYVETVFELIDKKKKIYTHKEYFENGKLKEEGILKFYKDRNDYLKEGEWKTYNEQGDVKKTEQYQAGELKG